MTDTPAAPEPTVTDAEVEAIARAVRRRQFERTGRARVLDESLPLTENELDDARAALAAAYAARPVQEPARHHIEHDGFTGTVIGRYTRLDGKRVVVLQQDGTNVVHVYGEKWLTPAAPPADRPRQEPTGWLYRFKRDGEWTGWEYHKDGPQTHFADMEAHPLYAVSPDLARLRAENAELGDHIKEYLSGVVGAVEASSYESLCLWQEYRDRKNWKQALSGYGITIGFLADMPVCISLMMVEVDGHKLLFWHATSQVVDHRMIDKWFDAHLSGVRRVDAQNFHNALPRDARRLTGGSDD